MKKNRWLWLILFILITVLTIGTVISESSSFDGEDLLNDFMDSNKIWLLLAIVATLANIVFEAFTLKTIIKVICPEYKGKGRYLLYSSADIYFSAITPFTSGGQPAMVYFMLKDKISIAGVTTSLILDYIACTLTNLFYFLMGFIVLPNFITGLSTFSVVLIIIGALTLVAINIALFFLLFNSLIFKKVATAFFKFFNKIFHFKNIDEKINKLNKTIEDYKQCSVIMKKNKKMVLKAFLLTLVQKLGKTLSTVFIFFAVIKSFTDGFKVWFVQVISDLGASFFPVPGGIGAREYILIDGFSNLSVIESAANLGLICETFSFYLGILISGLVVLFAVLNKRKKKSNEKK